MNLDRWMMIAFLEDVQPTRALKRQLIVAMKATWLPSERNIVVDSFLRVGKNLRRI